LGWDDCRLGLFYFKWAEKAAVCLYLFSNGLGSLRFTLILFQSGWDDCRLGLFYFKRAEKAAVCLYLISNGLRSLQFALIQFQSGWEGYAFSFFRSPYTSTAANGWAWHRAEIVRHPSHRAGIYPVGGQ